MVSALPDGYQGKFVLVVVATAAEGKADELQRLITAVSRSSNDPDKEPDTLTFRATRGLGVDSNKFTIIEEYRNMKAWEFHQSTEAYKTMKESRTIADVTLSFTQEFS
ncbi:protein tprxl [Moniliophthora roreri MCA 2997]|nr:protein tprxl [Moniliophthora roreri MCA 2997]